METTQPVIGMTDEELDAWLEEVRKDPTPDPPFAISAEYVRSLDLIVLKIDNGTRLVMQRELLEGLENATPEQLTHMELLGPGTAILWPDLDIAHYLPHLLEGKYSRENWKQARKGQVVAA